MSLEYNKICESKLLQNGNSVTHVEQNSCKFKYDKMPENAWQDKWTNDNVRLALNKRFQWAFTLRNGLCMTSVYAEAIQEFNGFVASLVAEFKDAGDPGWWFRGQANKDWLVVPGVMRENFIQSTYLHVPLNSCFSKAYTPRQLHTERMVMSDFKREGSGILEGAHSDEEWYIIAQHYGMPTRLLDWSLSPQLALWMALDDASCSDKDGVIVAMIPKVKQEKKGDMTFWNQKNRSRLFSFLLSPPDGLQIPEECEDLLTHEAVLMYAPNNFTGRQKHQLSRFTLHTPSSMDSEMICTTGVNDWYECKEFVVRAEYKEHYKAYLLASGMRRWNIYPDLDNLSRGIRDAYVVVPGNNVVIADRFS